MAEGRFVKTIVKCLWINFLENNEDEDVLCCVCSIGEPSHTCAICDKHVHAIQPCSDPCPDSEDGYGNKRICQVCKSGMALWHFDTGMTLELFFPFFFFKWIF